MKRLRCAALVLFALGVALRAGAQVTSSTGAINGTVADNTKAVLPGVTVTLSSPQMMGTRETVSDDQGRYQFAAIPPGDYKVTFALTGFSVLNREGIRVSVGFIATVNAELQLATQQESITVTGASPVVDTQSTKITNTFDLETMKNLPTARDFPSLMAGTPGVVMTRVDVGGSAAMSETGWRVYGMSNGGDQYTVEGIQVDSNYYNDFGSFQEVQIETAAHTAEMAVPGVMSVMIAKAGGNTYHGDLYADYEKLGWSSRNIDAAQIALGVTGGPGLDARDTNRTDKYTDVNANGGGYLLKDRLWWFGSVRFNESLVRFPLFPVGPQLTRVTSRNAKVTYNASRNNKLVGYYNHNFKYQPERFVNKTQIHPSSDETRDEDFPVGSWKVEYNSVLSSSSFLEMRYGDFLYDFYNFDRAPNRVLYIDTATQTRSGGAPADLRHLRTPQFNGAWNLFKSGWFGAQHNFKVGWTVQQFQQTFYTYGRVGRSGTPVLPDMQHTLVNGAPSQVVFNETPGQADQFQWIYSTYLNDAWQINNRLALNVGFRFDRYRGGYPDQVHNSQRYDPATRTFVATNLQFPGDPDRYHFNSPGPRIGAVWNVRGDGKTVVKANYGSYPWRPSPRSGIPGLNPNAETWTRTYVWTDLNGDRAWQPGEEGRLVSQVGGIANQFIDSNWKQNVTRELAAWLDTEVRPGFGVRTGLVWRGDENPQVTYDTRRPLASYNVARAVRDPGPDGMAGTADDGGTITVFDLDPAVLAATASPINVTTNHPKGQGSDHVTWEVSGVKRMSNHWSLTTSFAHTWSRELPGPTATYGGTTGPSAGNNYGTNPNDFIGTEGDGRKHFTIWQGKLGGTFMLPNDIKLSPVLRSQSGDPFGRIIVVRMNYGNQLVMVEPESTNRVANITLLDFRAEKGFRFRGTRLSGFLDVFNITNTNAEQDINQSSGSTFGRPLNIVGPRVARIGAKLEF